MEGYISLFAAQCEISCYFNWEWFLSFFILIVFFLFCEFREMNYYSLRGIFLWNSAPLYFFWGGGAYYLFMAWEVGYLLSLSSVWEGLPPPLVDHTKSTLYHLAHAEGAAHASPTCRVLGSDSDQACVGSAQSVLQWQQQGRCVHFIFVYIWNRILLFERNPDGLTRWCTKWSPFSTNVQNPSIHTAVLSVTPKDMKQYIPSIRQTHKTKECMERCSNSLAIKHM